MEQGPTFANGLADTGFADVSTTNGLTAQRSEVRAAHVRDGMSNTYLLGEKYLNPVDYATGNDIADDHSLFAGDDLDPNGWTDELPAQDTRGVAKTAKPPSRTGFSLSGPAPSGTMPVARQFRTGPLARPHVRTAQHA